MAKAKQTQEAVDNYLFAIGTPEGDILLKVGEDGNILELKDGATLEEAAKAFWNSFEEFLPVHLFEIDAHPNDAELGLLVRQRAQAKLSNK